MSPGPNTCEIQYCVAAECAGELTVAILVDWYDLQI